METHVSINKYVISPQITQNIIQSKIKLRFLHLELGQKILILSWKNKYTRKPRACLLTRVKERIVFALENTTEKYKAIQIKDCINDVEINRKTS